MRQGRFLFLIISLVGVNSVFGQFTPTGSPPATSLYYTNSIIGIGFTSAPTLTPKLQVTGTSTVPAAIFSSGNVGIGGLSTSFATGSLPSNLLHLRDGNMWVQRGTVRISAVNATNDALWVSNGRANLAGGIYAGYSGPGTETFMQYVPSVGIFEIRTNSSQINTYDFKIGSIVNNANLASPVLSTTQSMLFQTNSDLSTPSSNFKFLNGNTELATLTNTGSLGIGTAPATTTTLHIKGPAITVARIEPTGWNSSGTGTAKLELGDPNNYLQMVYGTGIKLTTYNSLILGAGNVERMRIDVNGRVDIGDKVYAPTDATVKLAVAGTIVAQKIKVTAASNWPDFVFDKKYALQPLDEVELYVKAHKHLPNIPSATELEASGIDTGEMLRLQMMKIEELTLHLIELKKEVVELRKSPNSIINER